MSTLTQGKGRSAAFQALVDLFRDNPEPSLEEAKKCAKNCLESTTKYEKISFNDIIWQNYKQQEDDLVMLVTAFDLLLRYTTNLLKPKLPNLWRTIPVTSGTFKARVDCMKGARDILKLIGYTIQTETAVKFPDEQLEPDRNRLVEVAAEILLAKMETEELINNRQLLQKYATMQSSVGFLARATPPQSADLVLKSSSSPPLAYPDDIARDTKFTNTLPAGFSLPPSNSVLPPGSMPPVAKPRRKNQPPVNQAPINQPPINQSPINQPPVNQPPVNQPPINQPPVLDAHKRKLEEIRLRHKELCQQPKHSYTVPNSSTYGGDMRANLQPLSPDYDCPTLNMVEKPSSTEGDILKATPPRVIPRATVEDANRQVQNYRKTQIQNTLSCESIPLQQSSGAEGQGTEEVQKPVPYQPVLEEGGRRGEGRGSQQDPESREPMPPNAQNKEQGYMEMKKEAKEKRRRQLVPEPEPVVPFHITSELDTARNHIKNRGMEMLRLIMDLAQEGYSPEEAHFMAKYSTGGVNNIKLEWNKRVMAMQQWVEVETPSVGIPSREEAVRCLLKNMGNVDKGKNDCHQERVEKITSVINKMKPFMEVPWQAAKAALCDCDMDIEKAVWALQRDGLGPLYEFINSEQEWAKVKQSDMGEIKELLLRGGGWTDDKSRLRLLVGEYKFEDTERANVVMQLMDQLEQKDGRGCELQFYIDAAKDHQTLQKAVNFLNVECPICMDNYVTHEMVLMPGCSHAVCKVCFESNFTNVMKTQTVKHFNCPVCSLPDMSNRDADQDMYQELLVTMVKQLCTPEVTDICNQKLRDHNLSKDPNFCWCANENCHAGFINDTGRDKIACPTCKKEMCFKCKKPWEREHEGLTCDQFAQWKHDNDPQLQQQGLAAHLEANGIECPACHSRYDLARGGCMHFKCTQCPYEFCSGCGQTFKENQACKKFVSCAKRGLHAHHPRDCLYFLRDFPVQELQGFLEKNNVPFDKEPPKAQLEAAAKESGGQAPQLRCSVMLQKETVDGPKDEACGTDAMDGCAGLCSVHYKEYLVTKINKTHLDPISLYDVHGLEAMLTREEMPALEKKDEREDVHKEKLIKHIQQVLPLQHVQLNAAAPPLK